MYKNKSSKIIATILTFILLILTYPNVYVLADTKDNKPPDLDSKGVVVMNADTGQIIYGKKQDDKFFPASTTKILTCLIVLDKVKNLDEKVTVGKNPPFADGTKIGIREGEICTVKELLYGLILESGNDCAEALAEYVSKTKEEFAKLMNEYAKKAGATNSNFKNPSGLPDEEHYTTPTDLALIMRQLVNNKTFNEICSTKNLAFGKSNLDNYVRHVNNHNLILDSASNYYYEPAFLSKKGYTLAAHFTNILAAKKNGMTLIVSNLDGTGINPVYNDIKVILDYCFDNYKSITLFTKNSKVGSFKIDDEEIPLVPTMDIPLLAQNDDNTTPKATVEFTAPTALDKNSYLHKGDVLTKGTVMVDGKKLMEIDLSCGIDRSPEDNTPTEDNTESSSVFGKILLGTLIGLLSLAILRIIYVQYRRAKKRKIMAKRKNN